MNTFKKLKGSKTLPNSEKENERAHNKMHLVKRQFHAQRVLFHSLGIGSAWQIVMGELIFSDSITGGVQGRTFACHQ